MNLVSPFTRVPAHCEQPDDKVRQVGRQVEELGVDPCSCLQGRAAPVGQGALLPQKVLEERMMMMTDDVLFILEEEMEVSTPWLPSPSRELPPAMPCPVLLPPALSQGSTNPAASSS